MHVQLEQHAGELSGSRRIRRLDTRAFQRSVTVHRPMTDVLRVDDVKKMVWIGLGPGRGAGAFRPRTARAQPRACSPVTRGADSPGVRRKVEAYRMPECHVISASGSVERAREEGNSMNIRGRSASRGCRSRHGGQESALQTLFQRACCRNRS